MPFVDQSDDVPKKCPVCGSTEIIPTYDHTAYPYVPLMSMPTDRPALVGWTCRNCSSREQWKGEVHRCH